MALASPQLLVFVLNLSVALDQKQTWFFFCPLSFIDQLIFLNICYCFYAFRNCQEICTLHTGMNWKLLNQTHFPAKSNVIRSTRFSWACLWWWYTCTCSYTHKVQAENHFRRFTNTSPKIRDSRGEKRTSRLKKQQQCCSLSWELSNSAQPFVHKLGHDKLMHCFYWWKRSKWLEYYWTLYTVKSTKTLYT